MKLIVGLGNPGEEYQATRHNLGWQFIENWRDALADDFSPWKKSKKLVGEVAQSKDFLLLKPRTFMNESGRSVAAALNFYKIKPEDLIVIHDDMDLPVGAFKLQTGRGAAGHHGVESIINSLGAKDFTRLRLGIKPLEEIKRDKDFVLGKFSRKEKELISQTIKKASEALKDYLRNR